MALWGNTDIDTGAPKYKGVIAGPKAYGSAVRGNTAFDNTTPDAFQNGTTFGVFGVDTNEVAVAAADGFRGFSAGWVSVRYGEGPVKSVTVTDAGGGFINGETAYVTGGSTDALLVVGTNSTSYLTSLTIANAGAGFTNTNMVGYDQDFNRDLKHLTTFVASVAASGFDNTSVIVVSGGDVNATVKFTTNSTGGATGGSYNITSKGVFPSSVGDGDVTFTVGNSTSNSTHTGTSGIVGNTASDCFLVNLDTSSGGAFEVTLGGRAGRRMTETLVALSSMSGDGGEGGQDDETFPDGA